MHSEWPHLNMYSLTNTQEVVKLMYVGQTPTRVMVILHYHENLNQPIDPVREEKESKSVGLSVYE